MQPRKIISEDYFNWITVCYNTRCNAILHDTKNPSSVTKHWRMSKQQGQKILYLNSFEYLKCDPKPFVCSRQSPCYAPMLKFLIVPPPRKFETRLREYLRLFRPCRMLKCSLKQAFCLDTCIFREYLFTKQITKAFTTERNQSYLKTLSKQNPKLSL